jgi:alkanesulfonate monooxygenase SsuD/methylene tetrahydromethanopterin reductase-like flavin-dependent oxidoreductase (luciferase family)
MRSMSTTEIAAFARIADDGPFSSLNAGERLTFDCNDPMMTLAIAGAVTTRVRLQTSVLCLPLHPAGVVAKQAATLERATGGRFSLGVGIGSRPLDYAVAPAVWAERARQFEDQIAFMRKVWAGVEPVPDSDAVGPSPLRHGGPELIIGAFAEKALRRAGRVADGVRSFDFIPDASIHRSRFEIVLDEWQRAGRPGRPRLIAATHFALGEEARRAYEAHARQYYGYSDSAESNALRAQAIDSPERACEFIDECAAADIDELVFTTTTTLGLDAVRELADVVASAIGPSGQTRAQERQST